MLLLFVAVVFVPDRHDVVIVAAEQPIQPEDAIESASHLEQGDLILNSEYAQVHYRWFNGRPVRPAGQRGQDRFPRAPGQGPGRAGGAGRRGSRLSGVRPGKRD